MSTLTSLPFATNLKGSDILSGLQLPKKAAKFALSDLAAFFARGSGGVSGTVGSRTALAAIASPTAGAGAFLAEAGREGTFVFSTADLSAAVAMDTQQAVYVAPAAIPSGGGGAWVRKYEGNLKIEWFGAVADWNGTTGTDNLTALLAATQFQQTSINMTPKTDFSLGKYYISSTLEVQRVIWWSGRETGSDENSAGTGGVPAQGTSIVAPINTLVCRIHNSNTTTNTTQTGNPAQSAAGSIIEGICFEQATQGTDLTAHGVRLRATATLRNCAFRNIAGNGIQNVAYSAGAGDLRGDTSQWRVLNCLVYSCGGDGLHTNGVDANAGYCQGFVTKACGGVGIYDTNTFGNRYTGFQITGYGGTNGQVCGVYNAGRKYQLVASVEIGEGLGSTTTPGTNQNVWYDLGALGAASAQFPQWVNGNTYTFHSPLHFAGYSNSSNVLGGYVEGGNTIAHAEAPTQIVPGFTTWTNITSLLQAAGSGSPNALVCPAGIGSYKKSSGPTQNTQFGGYQWTTLGGGNANSSDYSPDVLQHYRDKDAVTFHWGYDIGDDQALYYSNQGYMFGFTGPNTARTFGRSTAQPYYAMLFDHAAVDSSNTANAVIEGLRSAAPASGYHAQGEFFRNSAPTAGGTFGWVCVTSGTPGTWKAVSGIAP